MILRTSGIGVSIAFLREAQWGSRGREFDSRHSDHKSNDFTLEIVGFFSWRKPQAMLVEEKSRSVETVEKEPPFAIIRSG